MKTIAFSGWTRPPALMNMLGEDIVAVDYAPHRSLPDFFGELAARHADADHVIGWSLGGQLAVRAIALGVLRPKRLTLISAPYQFVACDAFLHGMAPPVYAMFRESYLRNTPKTVGKFAALIAKGDRHMHRVLQQLAGHHRADDTDRWLWWLEDLAAFSCRALALDHFPPTLLIHGREDAIVPPMQSEAFAAALPAAALHLLEGCGHAPHLHDSETIRNLIAGHLSS